jgi:putative membrane protein
MKKLLFLVISSILGLFIANYLLKSGFEIQGGVKALLIGGLILGLANFFIKPVLKTISLPLRIITLGIFGFIIDMLLMWLIIDVIMWQYMEINGLVSLFWVTLIVWCSDYIFSKFSK